MEASNVRGGSNWVCFINLVPIAFDVVNQTFVEVYVIPFSNYPHILTYTLHKAYFNSWEFWFNNQSTYLLMYISKLIKCFETYKIKLQEECMQCTRAGSTYVCVSLEISKDSKI